MANENKGITLAQIRSGAKEFVLDNSTVSDEIRAVQVALRVLGYWGSPNNPDGSFGSYSVAATRGYQKENGISVTGRMNKATLTHIEKSTGVLYAGHKTTPSVSYISKGLDYAKLNDTGAAITTITTKLKNLGFLTASKSTFDSTVRTAVGNFQSQYGLSKDYTVGQGTYAALLNPSAANWFSNGKVSLTAGMLARCGFSCTLLLPTFVTKLNAAMNNYGINTKVKARHFLAQVRAETANGYGIIEGGYKAGDGVYNGSALRSYSPFGGAGFLHLTHDYAYEEFGKLMGDARIYDPPKYAMQHVAIAYPDKSAGWFWKEKKKIDSSVNWNSDSDTIGKKVTGLVFGDETDWTKRRKTYYETICKVLL